jgi:hypothetical protein
MERPESAVGATALPQRAVPLVERPCTRLASMVFVALFALSVLPMTVSGCCPPFSDASGGEPAPASDRASTGAPSAVPTTQGATSVGGLGETQVRVGGGSVPAWPPSGPGCEKLVACCEAAQRVEPALGLGCQLSAAQRPVDCAGALQTVTSMIREMGRPLPDPCR